MHFTVSIVDKYNKIDKLTIMLTNNIFV